MRVDVEQFLPLTPKLFHILLALSEEPRNGYQLSARVEENSQGRIRLGPASQFENIHKLRGLDLVEEASDDPTLRTDGRKQRFWRITELGVRVMKAEMDRLSRDLDLALASPRLGRSVR